MSFLSGKADQITNPTGFQPSGFTSTGLTGSYSGGSFNVGRTGALNQQVGQLQSTFGQAAGAFGGLLGTVQPGFSNFRQAGLADIGGQQGAARSTLQQNLSQRRVLGSSFANASQSQQAADFAKTRSDFVAQTYLQELEASNKLIQEQFQAKTAQYSTGINQMNLEAGLAAELSSKATSSMTQLAQAQADLDARAQAGVGAFWGSIISAGLGKVTSMPGAGGGAAATPPPVPA